MKIISKENLLLILPMISDRDSFTLDDFEQILERFGDDYFVFDGQLKMTKKNEMIKKLRKDSKWLMTNLERIKQRFFVDKNER